MSYEVLARKYRPQDFTQVSGQQHILKSLIHALDQNRLHHAYLFTGTRGVGKTSLARLFAKSINCLEGISSTPCQKCRNCQAIAQGNFVDLIEIDAASRTKVEDTREVLDNIQYMPSQGRFKVYLIDEVHMLSNHSFNALLKTLEEPPEHVKFLLATTDPQKLPVTILSRCLQLNLKHLNPPQITQQLQTILNQEHITYEQEGLQLIAQAAKGSMRDALSISDQAIAFGNGQVISAQVKEMLGVIDNDMVEQLINFILDKNTQNIIHYCDEIISAGKDPESVLNALAECFYQSSIYAFLPKTQQSGDSIISKLSQQLTIDTLQAYYQSTIQAKELIPLAPTPQCGLGMALLKLCTFSNTNTTTATSSQNTVKPDLKNTLCDRNTDKQTLTELSNNGSQPQPSHTPSTIKGEDVKHNNLSPDWYQLSQRLNLKGTALQVVLNAVVHQQMDNEYILQANKNVHPLITDNVQQKIQHALSEKLGKEIKLTFTHQLEKKTNSQLSIAKKPMAIKNTHDHQQHITPAQINQKNKQNKINAIVDELNTHPDIKKLKDYGFALDQQSIRLKEPS
ncbi:DNA polymerase III subunit gamma/tau [Facilibium subflavum]|uniref:DNA polymerase III subunit gamma/tau n=1 Tax=Facilibium subflavum TaxID=2219058 RepID=UPI000E64997A|nr:DNA polymerase III subunit gamma/tau [Facilibium subflavum]